MVTIMLAIKSDEICCVQISEVMIDAMTRTADNEKDNSGKLTAHDCLHLNCVLVAISIYFPYLFHIYMCAYNHCVGFY